MFESIKEWIEGLFRPVIRYVATTGDSYIARTPTIYDIGVLSNVKHKSIQVTGNGGDLEQDFGGPTGGRTWIVQRIVFNPHSINATVYAGARVYYEGYQGGNGPYVSVVGSNTGAATVDEYFGVSPGWPSELIIMSSGSNLRTRLSTSTNLVIYNIGISYLEV